ncbi:AcrB/AcrD/AcrF family protein, partial [Burkholderia thailandensis]|nr:AcrB/AcrD/AcrF family protein [Burkholderia thailandensis]
MSNSQEVVGRSASTNFSRRVREYELRAGVDVADIQHNLVEQARRRRQRHAIATAVGPALASIAERSCARVKVVEVPPGPPVLAPIVADVYGTGTDERNRLAHDVRRVFSTTRGVVHFNDSPVAPAPQRDFDLDHRRAGLRGLPPAALTRPPLNG